MGETLTGISNLLAQGQPSGGAGASVHVFEGHNIRVVEIDGAPWFVAADVCRALALPTNKGVTMHLFKLDKSEKQTATLNQIWGEQQTNLLFPKSSGGRTPKTLINESGLYKLIMRSDKPEARAFQTWVTGTVLPAIRKDGGYVLGEEKVTAGEETIEDLEARLAEMKARKVTRLEAQLDKAMEKIAMLTDRAIEAENQLDAIHPALRGITARSLGETIVPGTVPLRELCASLGNPHALAGGDGLAADIGLRMSAAAV